jgi:DHA1 family bicyclomycin/chloramphenicol resistance-like MFS transporter
VEPREAGRTLSLIGAATGIAPTLAPVLGAGAAALGGWRLALALLAVYAAILLAAVWARLSETLPEAGRAPRRFGHAWRSLLEIARSSEFRNGTLAVALAFGALFTWLSTSPFLLIGDLGIAPAAASLLYAVGSAGFVAGGLCSAWLAARAASPTILLAGACLMVVGSSTTLVLLVLGRPGMVSMLLAMLPFYLGWGFAQPQAVASAMRPFPHIAGQASAWLGLLQQLGGVAIAGIAVWLGAGRYSLMVMTGASILLLAGAMVAALRSSRGGNERCHRNQDFCPPGA